MWSSYTHSRFKVSLDRHPVLQIAQGTVSKGGHVLGWRCTSEHIHQSLREQRAVGSILQSEEKIMSVV